MLYPQLHSATHTAPCLFLQIHTETKGTLTHLAITYCILNPSLVSNITRSDYGKLFYVAMSMRLATYYNGLELWKLLKSFAQNLHNLL